MKAYVRLHQWFNRTTELGKTNRIIDIMRPDACKHDYEIANAIEKWEERYRRIMEEDGAEQTTTKEEWQKRARLKKEENL